VLLPPLLTAAMVLAGRLARWVTRSSLPSAPTPRELLLLSGVSVLTHPILDTLNTYGVRWLMPFDGRWFYGDVLFIVDPWLWLALGLGVLLSLRRRRDARGTRSGRVRPARLALLAATLYAAAMALSGLAARRMVAAELERRYGTPVDRLLVSPHFATPFRRTVVAALGDRYVVGRFHWLRSPRLEPGPLRTYPRGRPDHPAVTAAAATPLGRRFLGWARFPSWRVDPRGGSAYLVHIVDLRYAERTGVRFGSVAIPVTAGPAAGITDPAGSP
jgi:inner membrane protein